MSVGIVLGVLVIVGTVLVELIMLGAAMMSDAPSQDSGMPLTIVAVFGLGLGGLLIGSHWMNLSW